MGAFVERCLAAPVLDDVQLGWRVEAIDWDAPGGGVSVTGPRGEVRARSCIVTVSTGVLRAGTIRFPRPLPDPHQDALAKLPMGLLSKIVFPARGTDLAAMALDMSVDRYIAAHGDAAMFFIARPMGADCVIGFCGGRAAWNVAGNDAALASFARDELAGIFGARARAWIGGDALCSAWGRDPLFAGAYSYGVPGCGDARAVLRQPVGDGRLVFAGEACCRGVAGTVQGAWETGRASAEACRP